MAASSANGLAGKIVNGGLDNGLDQANQLNSDPERIKFAYWVPNVSGGLVISKVPQQTDWTLDANIRYAQIAEKVGFEYALSQIRFMAGYGAVSELRFLEPV
ncbi:MAG: hypothetical protein Q9165_000287 [Trypethelium subeluteriae]